MRRSTAQAGQWYEYKTATTLRATVDRDCDVLPWRPCVDGSRCCGAVDGWGCRLTSCPDILPSGECARTQPTEGGPATAETMMCQPPHGGPLGTEGIQRRDERMYASWGARGTPDFN